MFLAPPNFGVFHRIRWISENQPISFRIKDICSKSSEIDIICMNIDALEDIINDESENKVQDTVHNALSNGEAGQDFYL